MHRALEIRQWLPEHLAHPNEEGWREAFTKLDAMLIECPGLLQLIIER